MMRALLLGIALLAIAAQANAQSDAAATSEARRHFQQGLTQAQQGNLPAALREFETAYALQPHFSVLYNIGRAHAALGEPVEAVAAFERYLEDGGAQVGQARREEVASLVASARASIGRLRLIVPAGVGMRVWLDGQELSPARIDTAMDLATGEHSVLHAQPDYAPESLTVTVTPGKLSEVRLVNGGQPPRNALLTIHCDIPDVVVAISGKTVTKTPVAAPLLVPSGTLPVSFSRSGYRGMSQPVTTRSGASTDVRCDPKQLIPLPDALSARLAVTTTPADATVLVDGQPFTGAALTAGRHRVQIERDGFELETRMVSLEANETSRQEIALKPTRASRERQRLRAAKRTTWATILGGGGLAIAGSGVGVFVWNSNRYEDWRSARDPGTAATIQRTDDAAIALMVVGGSLMLAGSWLFLTSD